jgi:GNAT superfamily N-acetyltransferase
VSAAVTIRNYALDDLADCRALWVELTAWHREIYDNPGIGGEHPGLQFDEHLHRVGPEHLWVAVVSERVVGLAGMIPGDREAELEPVVVSKDYRGRGIGLELARSVVAHAKTTGVRFLCTRPVARNAGALRFFHRLGFRVLGHVELLADFAGREWKSGCSLAGCDFEL